MKLIKLGAEAHYISLPLLHGLKAMVRDIFPLTPFSLDHPGAEAPIIPYPVSMA